MLHHPNCVEMRQSFYTNGDKPEEVYLNVVMDYIPDTAYRVMKQYLKMKQMVPNLLVKLYSYQLLRSIAYIHAKGILHCDIKLENIFMDADSSHASPLLADFDISKDAEQRATQTQDATRIQGTTLSVAPTMPNL